MDIIIQCLKKATLRSATFYQDIIPAFDEGYQNINDSQESTEDHANKELDRDLIDGRDDKIGKQVFDSAQFSS